MRVNQGDYTVLGQAYAPQSSLSQPARLIISKGKFELRPESKPNTYTAFDSPLKDASNQAPLQKLPQINSSGEAEAIKLDPQLGNLIRKMHLPDGILFETDDHDTLALMEAHGFWTALHRTEKLGWHIIPFAIITPIVAFGFYRLMIPLIISLAMFMTPDGLIHTIDKNTMKAIDFKMTHESSIPAERQTELKHIFNDLAQTSRENSARTRRLPDYKLLFRDSTLMGPNAFALPGGTIVLTDELVNMFPDDEYVITAILAHEIGHVEYEHSLQQLYRALGMAALIGFIAGDAGPMLEDIILEGSALLSLSFSREHEMESDDFSYELLSQNGIRADGLVTFFERLETELPSPSSGEWLSTHPLSEKRILNIKNKMADTGHDR